MNSCDKNYVKNNFSKMGILIPDTLSNLILKFQKMSNVHVKNVCTWMFKFGMFVFFLNLAIWSSVVVLDNIFEILNEWIE